MLDTKTETLALTNKYSNYITVGQIGTVVLIFAIFSIATTTHLSLFHAQLAWATAYFLYAGIGIYVGSSAKPDNPPPQVRHKLYRITTVAALSLPVDFAVGLANRGKADLPTRHLASLPDPAGVFIISYLVFDWVINPKSNFHALIRPPEAAHH